MSRIAIKLNSWIGALGAVFGVVVGIGALLYAMWATFDAGTAETSVATGRVMEVIEKKGGVHFRLEGSRTPFAVSMVAQDRTNVVAALSRARGASVTVVYQVAPFKPWFTDEEHYSVNRVDDSKGAVVEHEEVRQSLSRERVGLAIFGIFVLLCSGFQLARLS